MKIVSQEEYSNIQFKESKGGTTKLASILPEVALMDTGDHMLIEKEEWPLKSTPTVLTNNCYKKKAGLVGHKLKIRTKKDGSAWVITKVKN